MADLATALVSFREFLDLPDPADGARFELHDGEVVTVPPPKPLHVLTQKKVLRTLDRAWQGEAITEFPYRPHADLQFWYADVAWVPASDVERVLVRGDYPAWAPPLIVEVLSPSNRPEKINRQRIVALSAGTQEFWVVDPVKRTVQVTTAGGGVTTWSDDDLIPSTLGDAPIAVRDLLVP